ncbi:MAG: hypothetical protein FWD74_08200 [Actinomycetia bacterium]|nr:hypothetical protein [Actinomycetes bacterium]
MKTVSRRQLNQYSGRIIDEILLTGEPVEVVTRGADSVVISRKIGSVYQEWKRLDLVAPATGWLDQAPTAPTPRGAEELAAAIGSDH